MKEEGFKYYAFISYSHKDKKTAQRLHRRLRSYHLPSKLIQSHPELPKKLGEVFLDEANLVAKEGSLTESLRDYLDDSNYLILICSPDSAKSQYVNDEVEYFMKTGRRSHIVPLIVRGIPHSKDPDAECFVPAILNLPRELEPLGIDLKTYGERDSFLRVIATTLGLDLEYFISIEARERKKKTIIFSSVAAVFVLGVCVLGWYGMLNKKLYDGSVEFFRATKYYSANNYVQSIEGFKKAAKNGNVMAQMAISFMYIKGSGVEQDYGEAIKWLEKAANNNNTDGPLNKLDAQFILGGMYENGLGVEKNYVQAIAWYQKAADDGNADAQNNLAYMYLNGIGVEEDHTKARKWFEKAAYNSTIAQNNLGFMYIYGHGVEKDYTKAREWFEKAAYNNSAMAQCYLGIMYYAGLHGVEKDYTRAKIWFEQAAKNNNVAVVPNFVHKSPLYDDGDIYDVMSELNHNYSTVEEWFTTDIDKGRITAQYCLGNIYYEGYGVEADFAKAAKWYEKAAYNNSGRAQNQIAYMYLKGLGVEKDYARAKIWFERAVDNGDVMAQYNLGEMYECGDGVEVDYVKAAKWYEKAASNGHVTAQRIIGFMYAHGVGIEQDYAKAKEWYEKAVKNGDVDAQKELDEMQNKANTQDNQ